MNVSSVFQPFKKVSFKTLIGYKRGMLITDTIKQVVPNVPSGNARISYIAKNVPTHPIKVIQKSITIKVFKTPKRFFFQNVTI